jgi:hypothetical protein
MRDRHHWLEAGKLAGASGTLRSDHMQLVVDDVELFVCFAEPNSLLQALRRTMVGAAAPFTVGLELAVAHVGTDDRTAVELQSNHPRLCLSVIGEDIFRSLVHASGFRFALNMGVIRAFNKGWSERPEALANGGTMLLADIDRLASELGGSFHMDGSRLYGDNGPRIQTAVDGLSITMTYPLDTDVTTSICAVTATPMRFTHVAGDTAPREVRTALASVGALSVASDGQRPRLVLPGIELRVPALLRAFDVVATLARHRRPRSAYR